MHSSYLSTDLTQAAATLHIDEYERTKDEFLSKVYSFIDMLGTRDVASVGGAEDIESVAKLLRDMNSAMDNVTAKMNRQSSFT